MKDLFQRIKIRVAAKIQLAPSGSAVHNTTVMQVHQWLNGCEYGPPVMMSFDEKGRLRARILREIHKNNKFVLEGWTRKSFKNRWVKVAIDIVNKNGKSDVEIFLGGKSVLK